MKIAFMGTPDFSVPCLEALINSKDEVAAVFCQPDKPKGRTQELVMPPTKQVALKHNIPVYQPVSLKNSVGLRLLEEIKPDLVIVVAYGKILPQDFLSYPKYGCINIHASLLPKYRGAAPIQWAIINGDKTAGVTSMQMDAGLDTGDMLLTKEIEIGENETGEELFERLSVTGSSLLLETIEKLKSNQLVPKKQNEAEATYVGMLSKEMSNIDWNCSALEIHNKIRGLYSWPGASTYIGEKVLKIHKARLSAAKTTKPSGTVVDNKGKISVSCGDGGCVDLIEVQLEGKKRMNSEDFLRGKPIETGFVLGK